MALNIDSLKSADSKTLKSVRKNDYCEVTVKAPTTSAVLIRKSGLKPLTKYVFEVRARNDGHKGEWSSVSKYIGMGCALLTIAVGNTHFVYTHSTSYSYNWPPVCRPIYPL